MNRGDLVDTTDEIGIRIREVVIAKIPVITDHDFLRALKSILRRPKQSSSNWKDLSGETGNDSTHTQCGTTEGLALENRVAESLIHREIRDIESIIHKPSA
jgi:hypothetical protein